MQYFALWCSEFKLCFGYSIFLHLAANAYRHTHIGHCCSVLLKISWYVLCRIAGICAYLYTHTHTETHTCIHFLLYFLWVLLRIFVTFPFLLSSVNSLVAYSTNGTWGFPAQQEPSGGVPLSPTVRPVFSPPLGVVPSLIIYKTLSLGFLNSGIAHLQVTYIPATAGSLVSRCTTVLTRKSSTVWPYFTTSGALGTHALLPCSLDIFTGRRMLQGRGQLLR